LPLSTGVATPGPAGDFQLGSSQGASAELASRLTPEASPVYDERLRSVWSGVGVSEDGSYFHSLRNLEGPAAVNL
jgi:hypothetical protein